MLAATALCASTTSALALDFQLSFIAGTSLQEQQSFITAASMWSAKFSDPVTVKLTVGTGALDAGVLAQAGSRRLVGSYSSVAAQLALDATSALDDTAVANLTAGPSFGLLMNRTSDNPNGAGSATPFVDANGSANNSQIRLTAANARALGYTFGVGGVSGGCTDCDAFIQFSTGFSWDHDGSDGITAAAYDFVGIAVHEIGHALGFVSGVDTMDANSTGAFGSNAFTYVSPLDLFRWSDESRAANVSDWTADNRDKYFSVDRGLTEGALFSNGVTRGDGRQASHWKDNQGIGILDPTAARGEFLSISENDLMALDAIGWDRAAAVPIPSTLLLSGLGLLALLGSRRGQRRA
ncbi:NF038122 family metalloprotease [Paucibacter sp. JuS9]|uniref:NF038122 family metalloprotease n=1 Tax=Paucibacter sp. JuS9 TaxID=3228748 RepID=UPI003757287D